MGDNPNGNVRECHWECQGMTLRMVGIDNGNVGNDIEMVKFKLNLLKFT